MKLFEFLKSFFNKIFNKNTSVKMLEAPVESATNKDEFINSLRINTVIRKKKKVETLICDGDGLGIQNSILY